MDFSTQCKISCIGALVASISQGVPTCMFLRDRAALSSRKERLQCHANLLWGASQAWFVVMLCQVAEVFGGACRAAAHKLVPITAGLCSVRVEASRSGSAT